MHILVLGASGDIGGQIVKDLAEAGHTFSLHYHTNHERIADLVEVLPAEAVFEIIQSDLSTMQGIEHCIQHVQFNPEAIIFAQGQSNDSLFTEASTVEMDALLKVHVQATWHISQAFLPAMIKKQFGHLLVLSSVWGEVGASHEVVYSSVKGAQNSFVKALAKEVAPSGVLVNGIAPGFIDTQMNQQFSDEERQTLKSSIPLGRLGKAEDISHLVTFLLSEQSSYITGQVMHVTGGWMH